MTRFSCNLMRVLFAPEELKGKSVYRSQKKTPLEHAHVEQIKQLLVIVYGETNITDKAWSESICVNERFLRKYQKED